MRVRLTTLLIKLGCDQRELQEVTAIAARHWLAAASDCVSADEKIRQDASPRTASHTVSLKSFSGEKQRGTQRR
jgi:hypothetical protein